MDSCFVDPGSGAAWSRRGLSLSEDSQPAKYRAACKKSRQLFWRPAYGPRVSGLVFVIHNIRYRIQNSKNGAKTVLSDVFKYFSQPEEQIPRGKRLLDQVHAIVQNAMALQSIVRISGGIKNFHVGKSWCQDLGQVRAAHFGHHHVGHIGILGLEKSGVESYQITLGGDGTETAAIGKIIGPGFNADEIIPAIERLVMAYLELRSDASEVFLTTFRRLGPIPFKTALYPAKEKHHAA